MNKRKVEAWLPKAIEALEENDKICNKGKIEKSFRGQISSFGAAVTMGSFKAAVAFFGNNGESAVERSELIRSMYYIVKNEWKAAKDIVSEVICMREPNLSALKEDFLNASLAIKLAMNAFELDPNKNTIQKEVEEKVGE
ncbi:MAG: hypothetical protein J6C89_06655 [Clostridia bacterium]|nr:hypothetical protein [Clostridia bacterium]